MTRKQGKHLERDETKKAIVEFILSNNKEGNDPGIREPKIRRYLEEKYGMTDKNSIRKHLKDLNFGTEGPLLGIFPYEKSGQPNYWDIIKIKHLINIHNKFPAIQLNKYEKALLMVLQKNSYDISTFRGIEFYVKLFLSASFFNECIGTDIKTLWEKVRKIYARKHPFAAQRIKDDLIFYYDFYKNRYPILNISYELFESTMTQISQREMSTDENVILSGGLRRTNKHFAEKFLNIWEVELLKLPKEKLDKMHREITGADRDIYWGMNIAAYEMNRFNKSFETERFDLLFEYYVDRDTIEGVDSEEENDFTIKINANEEESRMRDFSEYLNEDESGWTMNYAIERDLESKILSKFEHACVILAKYKHPSVFGNIYDSPSTTISGILEIFDKSGELWRVMPNYAEERMIFLSEYKS